MHINLFTDSGVVNKKGIVVSTTVLEGDSVSEIVVHRPFEFHSEHSVVTEHIGLYNGLVHTLSKYPHVESLTIVCDNLDLIRFLSGEDAWHRRKTSHETFARLANTINRLTAHRSVTYIHQKAKNCAQIQLCDMVCNRVIDFCKGKSGFNTKMATNRADFVSYQVCGLA